MSVCEVWTLVDLQTLMTHPEDDSSGVTYFYCVDVRGKIWVMVYRATPGDVPGCKVQVFSGFRIVCLKFVEFPGWNPGNPLHFCGFEYLCGAC